ncbi:CusA/CzcA family heavy metal efflux RND transporter [Fulvivirgaceae bacterium BMA12]|uniref:CusA/CzcA family heavy metal efflux RND transporter n=1 Tax=Agaribacillus aureus TaxID=3051825 RepID=A0ABT8LJ28_9BACT|nr:CusA/CzcA family heavy metal efflux RND transporter [Fulvivirgaceae bacterium BMA12]
MIDAIVGFSIRNKLIVILFILAWIGWGVYSVTQIPIGAVPDITNNQVQVITTSRNLSTQDIEQFITYPVELEMANLPGVVEIRSISKFGLSVVTVVFEDDMGTFLPRQLISEKLTSASEKIPPEFGKPEMGPITTGLGEIYQYILDVKPGYEDEYSTMDLRTIQDWIVKRQLSGIPGVVEVNTWGGFLKQYEVAVDPERLKAIDITISEVFEALENNNNVTGGGYIEKATESYFVRGEGMVKSLEDIEKIVVTSTSGVPVLIRDIGEVTYGSANRFGAITGNGKGEKVMGQIMMLKDANSSDVIKNVKKRVAEVQELLPEGLVINAFLERTELIEKTTFTVTENLVLGALIVIFVVVLLLGNFRSGLIVASIIPLSLLFGISMMNLFGISANLMSLGAIDFGIIIDGAVIIIEYIVFKTNQHAGTLLGLKGDELSREKDRMTLEGTRKMMQPAIFGQVIILIVFIPVLSLSGIEGKMFRPMAWSFGFALLGAMILSLTYVPVLASIICKPSSGQGANISDKLMKALQNAYKPVIHLALRSKRAVLTLAAALLLGSVFIFLRMGGEFIPTLNEGDFVVQPVLKTGTSLGKTVEIMTRLENILIDEFPEVEQVVTRIGAAEVPTDPMSMEEADVIIKLKPKNEWSSARTREELADKMKAAMSIIPGLGFEFTQPIEMRFNELITGVRSDVAIKIYGEDLDELFGLANQVNELIHDVQGAADINVEKTTGLPQMAVKYNRDKIAQYGLNINELNRIVRMAFAGESAGILVEGEKRFDLVVRLGEAFRKDITNLQNLYVNLSGGEQIPLREVATVEYSTGPAKISRDDAKRRIVIGINIRNRDVESLVNEIQDILSSQLDLPSGYYITYGGQFENLQKAKERLKVAVPIALILIFIMLYFTFHSFRQALMVYSAIPLAAIGGILLLWIRGLPFSISAGVGFIALFGIAVLNGIVLIEFFNELKEKGVKDIRERVLKGTQMRLRPVLLTASAAALGFLPMAFSTSAGAEVQRPLATVVVGGLFTATILTLVVLPVIYTIFSQEGTDDMKKERKRSINPGRAGVMVLLLAGLAMGTPANAQSTKINLDDAIDLAIKNNKRFQASQMRIEQQQKLEKTAFDIPKTSVYHSFDENNITENGSELKVFGIGQSINFPTVYAARKKWQQQKTTLQKLNHVINERLLKKQVSQAYYQVSYQLNRLRELSYLDSLYNNFARAAARRYELGETNYLEKITADARYLELNKQQEQTRADVDFSYQELLELLQVEGTLEIPVTPLTRIEFEPYSMQDQLKNNPGTQFYQGLSDLAALGIRVEKSQMLPDLQAQYFIGRSQGDDAINFNGYQFGIGIPIFAGAQRGKIQAARIEKTISEKALENNRIGTRSHYQQLNALLQKHEKAIVYYESQGLKMADEIIGMAQKSYLSGETDYLQYIQSLESASQINLGYLESLNQYNQTVLEIQYLIHL